MAVAPHIAVLPVTRKTLLVVVSYTAVGESAYPAGNGLVSVVASFTAALMSR